MEFDIASLPKSARYKILSSCVAPRPIAWVTSQSSDGLLNAAPYSFFNMMGDDPLTIVLGLMAHGEGRFKDTAENLITTREFVVNLVDEAHGEAMNITCMAAPSDIDETGCARLTMAASRMVKPPRISTVPASFECRTLRTVETGPYQMVVIAEVVYAHIDDRFILNAEDFYVDTPAMRLIARMHGSGWYSRQTDLFQMSRPSWPDWIAGQTP